MAASETVIDVPNNTVNNSAMDSDSEDEIVVRRKNKSTVVLSDDEGEEKLVTRTIIENDVKDLGSPEELTGSKTLEDRDTVTNCSQTIVGKLTDLSSASQIASLQGSDNENDLISENTNSSDTEDVVKVEKKRLKRITNTITIDSDDERNSDSLFDEKECLSAKNSSRYKKDDEKSNLVTSSESEGEERNINNQGSCNNNILKSNKISSVIDSDSEEDVPLNREFGGSSNEDEPVMKSNAVTQKEKSANKKRTGSIRAAKNDAMREIQSESQRMLRESEVCLPYHRPKQRTLKEFLNRKKDLPMLPKTLTTAAKVKMSVELVGKVLEEKEKEAELFYKSSSDSDDEEAVKAKSSISDVKLHSTVAEDDTQSTLTIEETQKITKKDLHNKQSNKEVIKQGDKNLGFPRKLFTSSENEPEQTDAPLPIDEDDHYATTEAFMGLNQRRKEFKHGLKDVSVPRNLFGSECDEPMDIADEQTIAERNDDDKINKVNHDELEFSDKSDQLVENGRLDVLENSSTVVRNESMEEEMENFELKMSEELCEITNDKRLLHDIDIPKTDTMHFEAITETPLINNRELAKSNEGNVEDCELSSVSGNKEKSDNFHLVSEKNKQQSSDKTESSDNDESYEENKRPIGHVYGLPLPDFGDNETKKSKTRILPDIMRITPKLEGSPDMMIELSSPKKGVNNLLRRFLNHSVTKKPESSSEVTVISTEQTESGLKVTKETLPYKIPTSDKNDDPELSRPGAKLVRLKEELQQQMTMRRTKEWKDKELGMKESEIDDMNGEELSDCGMDDEDEVEDEEEVEEAEEEDEVEELNEDQSNDAESDEGEEDSSIKKREKKCKNPFLDAEAEVSEEEEEISDGEDGTDEDINKSSSEDDEDKEHEDNEVQTSGTNKSQKLKRIIKAFDDEDANDSKVGEECTNSSQADNNDHCPKSQTNVDMFATNNNSDDNSLSSMEDDLPVYQQRIDERSQFCATPSVANNSLSIVSPITQLTALNTGSESVNMDSRLSQNPLQLTTPHSLQTTPIEAKFNRECDSMKREKLQKKLFDDVKQTPNDMELMSLGSDKFSDNGELDGLVHTNKRTIVTDAELLDLCSGTFATQFPDINSQEVGGRETQDCSTALKNSSFPSSDKSLESQVQKPDPSSRTCRLVLSSDDDDESHNLPVKDISSRKKKRRKVKMLQLSDDENENENEGQSDDGNLSFTDDRQNGEETFVDYDSEENEIVVPKKDIRKAAARFLDEEAELSESEWGSADEDERDLDRLDVEEGDLEDIDQDQVKKQLEKMHMKQVLDEDRREVRLLQEILLEDGDLHSDSAGRQRKFKWKNIDEADADSQVPPENNDDEAVALEPNEAESELEWRKQRLEREQFLKEQRMKEVADQDEKETEDSELFKLGMKALKKTKNCKLPDKDGSELSVTQKAQTSVTRHTIVDLFTSPGCGKKTFALQNAIHRGSFLARGEESLARLSLITKQNSDQAIIRTKKSRNFVFAHLSPAIEAADENDSKLDDQKETDTPEKTRKRKPTFNQTPVASKKSKKEYDSSKPRNKLFN